MKFYGQFEIPVDRFLFERYFPDTGIKGTFIECGAFDGLTECSCRFFEETMGWTGFNLEPVPWNFEKLSANRPNSRNFKLGLSSRPATVPFHAVVHPQYGRDTTIGAIRHDPALKEALESQGCTFEEIAIEVTDWAHFVEAQNILHVTLMVLDVEGHELEVLSAMQGSTVLPEIMCVEFGNVGFDRLHWAMRELGYVYDIHSFANAFFIRHDVVSLYALRRCAASPIRPDDTSDDTRAVQEATPDSEAALGESQNALAASEEANRRASAEISFLRQREAELSELLNAITNSKGWKALEIIKSVIFYGRRQAAKTGT